MSCVAADDNDGHADEEEEQAGHDLWKGMTGAVQFFSRLRPVKF